MTLTTFKSVGGTSKPTPAKKPAPAPKAAPKAKAKAPAAAPAKAKRVSDAVKFRIAKPAEPSGGRYVVISGEGTMPIGADNWRRVARGVSISVSEAELVWLENSGVPFKRA